MTEKICNNCGRRVDSSYNYCPDCKSQSFRNVNEITVPNDNLGHKLLYWNYNGGYALAKTKLASFAVFLSFFLLWAQSPYIVVGTILAVFFAGITFLIGVIIHKFKTPLSLNKVKFNDYGIVNDLIHLLFYWQDNNGNYIVSKTKILSVIVFILMYIYSVVQTDYISTIFTSLLFALILTTPVFIVGTAVHKLTYKQPSSTPKITNTQPKKVESVEKSIPQPQKINEYAVYEDEITQLQNEYLAKEKQVTGLIEKRFAPPQLTYTRFMSVVDKSHELFSQQVDSALTMINLASDYSPKIENEIKAKIKVMRNLLGKLNNLTNELVLSGNDSSDEEVNELFENINDLIDSVHDYN